MAAESDRKYLLARVKKLVALTAELKAQTAQSPGDPWPPETIKKVAQVEKLARSIKRSMKS